jgi:ADP-ribose pyrophosphatase YjhB (NUDIX family)
MTHPAMAGEQPIAQLLGPDGIVQRTRLAAYAWCELDGAVLLSRIAPGYPDPGMWTLPGGGLDFGEDPAEGVRREVDEETGLAVRLDGLAGIRSEILDPSITVSGHRLHNLQIVYRGTIVAGTLRPEVDGSSDLAAWIPFAELDRIPLVDLVDFARGVVGR